MYSEIHTLLEGAVQDVVTASKLPPLVKSNRVNDTTQPFTRFTLIPSATVPETVGLNGKDRHSGFAQVDFFLPIGTGMVTSLACVDAILDAFPRHRTLNGTNFVLHTTSASPLVGEVINKLWKQSVQINYRALVPI